MSQLQPVPLSAPRLADGRVVFPRPDADVIVEGDPSLVCALIHRCDGHRTIDAIVSELAPVDQPRARRLLRHLIDVGVVADRQRTFLRLHADGRVAPSEHATTSAAWRPPSSGLTLPVTLEPNSLGDLLLRRRSAAASTPTAPLTAQALTGIVAATYAGTRPGHRTVPSAGALHPLILHVDLTSDLPGIGRGLWWFDPLGNHLARQGPEPRDVRGLLGRDAETAALIDHCQAVLIVSADLERPASKYGNRGYRYALIEAGAAAQNALLAATDAAVRARAYGAFDDDRLAALLGLPQHVRPLLTIGLG